MYTLSRSLHALAVGFRLPWQSSDWHCRRLLRALFRDLSPALEGITTTKTTPPTPDLPKLKLRKSERENRRLMQLEDRDSYKKESSRSWGEEGRKKQRGRKRRFPPVRREKNTGTWKWEAEWETVTEWVHGWIRKDQDYSLIRQERQVQGRDEDRGREIGLNNHQLSKEQNSRKGNVK